MALVLKTSDVKASVGSNPTPSAREISSAVEQLVYTEWVGGSIPSSPMGFIP